MTTSRLGSQSVNSGDEVVELVRVINRIEHETVTDQKEETDYVVRNNSDENKSYIFLPLNEFKVNLEGYDEDGTKLNFYPNEEVKNLLETLEEEEPSAYQTIEDRFDGINYTLLIQLPDEQPIEPGELRTITLTSGQSESVEYHRISDSPYITGWVTHWKRKFFTVPSFVAKADRTKNHSYSEFFIVKGPPAYATVADTYEKSLEGLYENGYGHDTGILSTRLPPVTDTEYTWELTYEFISDRRGLMRALGLFAAISFGSALLLLLIQALHFEGHLGQLPVIFETGFETVGQTYSAGIISGIVGIMYAVRAEWAERYRLLCLVPLLLHIASWAIWFIIA